MLVGGRRGRRLGGADFDLRHVLRQGGRRRGQAHETQGKGAERGRRRAHGRNSVFNELFFNFGRQSVKSRTWGVMPAHDSATIPATSEETRMSTLVRTLLALSVALCLLPLQTAQA